MNRLIRVSAFRTPIHPSFRRVSPVVRFPTFCSMSTPPLQQPKLTNQLHINRRIFHTNRVQKSEELTKYEQCLLNTVKGIAFGPFYVALIGGGLILFGLIWWEVVKMILIISCHIIFGENHKITKKVKDWIGEGGSADGWAN